MHFFLTEIVARVVAIYLFIDGSRKLWNGLAEGKIAFLYYDFLDTFFNAPNWIAHRNVAPLRYWMQIGSQIFTLVACLVIAIFGWFSPK